MRKKMITKKELKNIVKEDFLKECTAPREAIAEAAAEFGRYFGGFPHLAKAFAKILEEDGRSDAAKALMDAYKKAQSEVDLEYSLHYPE